MMIDLLVTLLQHLDPQVSAEDVRDVLWIASTLSLHDQASMNPGFSDRQGMPLGIQDSASEPILPESPVTEQHLTSYSIPDTGTTTDTTKPSNDSVVDEPLGRDLYQPGANDDMSGQGGLPFRTPAAPALSEPLALSRALRPLMRRVPSRVQFVHNEEATVRRISEQGIWLPVLQPALIRWFDIVIIADEHSSMLLWQQTVHGLVRLLERHGAFRDVRLWRLRHDTKGAFQLFAGSDTTPRPAATLLDPGRRRLILLVSDALGPAWYSGAIARQIALWSAINPVSLVQPLPQSLWRRTALRGAELVRLQASSPGTVNKNLTVRPLYDLFDEENLRGTPLPTITIESEPFARWAAMVAGKGDASVGGVILSSDVRSGPTQLQTLNDMIQQFQGALSPTARQLARLLTYTAPLTLPVIRLVQYTMLPQSRQVHLAEVLLSGILRLASYQETTESHRLRYEFSSQFAALLRDSLPASEAARVITVIASFIEQEIGHPLDFTALLGVTGEQDPDIVHVIGRPFTRINIEFLRRLGGEYAKQAQHLENLMATSIRSQYDTGLMDDNHSQQSNRLMTTTQQSFSPLADRSVSPNNQAMSTLSIPMHDRSDGQAGSREEIIAGPEDLTEIIPAVIDTPVTPKGFPMGHALLIGAGSYIDHESIPNLPMTVEDVRQLAAILADPQYCGYPAEQVTVLHDEAVTRAGVLAALDYLAETTTAESTVFIYYAGHSYYDASADMDNRAYFLLTHETELAPELPLPPATLTPNRWVVPSTAISQADLLTALKRLPAARVILMLNTSPPPELFAAALLGTGSGRILITPCRGDQLAQSGPGPTTLFAEYLLPALQGQDVPNRNGTINVLDLVMSVYPKVRARVLNRYYRHHEPELTILRGVDPFPVALYKGGTSLGNGDTAGLALEGDAVRIISIETAEQALITLLGQEVVDTPVTPRSFPMGHALLIGVNSYLHHESIANVPMAVEDVRQLAAILTDPQYCGYPVEQVTVLHDEAATRAGVLAALDQLVATTTADSTVLIYYAGHGHYDAPESTPNRAYFLTMHETDLTPEPPTAPTTVTATRWVVPGTAISQAELLTALQRLPAQRVLLIFNACHAGELHPTMSLGAAAVFSIQGSNPPEPLAAALLGTGSGRVIMSACRDSQVSQAGPGPTTIFAEYLLTALQGHDVPNRQGTISVFDLYMTVYEKVKARVLDRYYRHQEPVLTTLRGVGPFPVALYQGATSRGITDAATPPAGDAVRLISIQQDHHDRTLLAQYRANLRHLEYQVAGHGGERQAPVSVMNQVHDIRKNIAALKQRLRAHGASVADDPGDFPAGQPDAPSAQALLDTMPLDVVPNPAPIPAFSRMPYSPNPHFVGRDDALLALAQALKGGGRVALGPRAAATGLGGIGKTSVAAEFVHRYGQYFAGGVFWLSFADPTAVAGEIAACGGAGFLALSPAFGDLTQDEQVSMVQAAWRQDLPRLLVFDNCEDPKLVEAWAPPTGGCRVLITSRRQRWPGELRVQTQRLAVLARDQSIALLQQLAPRLTNAEANALATELGDLPLALQLAGSYLAQFERTKVATYLAELTSDVIIKHPSLQGQHDADVSLTAHDRHVGRTVLVSYQYLKPSNPTDVLALQLLARAVCFAPGAPIPLDLLLATVGLDAMSTAGQESLQCLLNLGLLTMEADDAVQMHRLIHAFVQTVVNDRVALDTVEQAVSDRAFTLNRAGYPSAMYPLRVHLNWLTSETLYRNDSRMATLCHMLAFHLHTIGDYGGAKALYERALTIQEQVLGPNHPDIATSLNNLASLLQTMGHYDGAQTLYERALSLREQWLGPNHLDTATILNNFAGLLHTIGKYGAARSLYERSLAIREQALGLNHPSTAMSLNNLATLLESIGDYAAAQLLHEQVLATRENVLGPNHPDIATSLNNLASVLQSMGDYSGAQPLYERALAIREQALGPNHPDVAASLNNLAGVLQSIGDSASAQPLYERALTIQEQALGPNHPDIATSLNNVAGLLQSIGQSSAARPLYERALQIHHEVLGSTHPATATSLNNLAGLLQSDEDYAAARPLYEEALAIREQQLGSNHPDTATSLNNLATLLEMTGEYAAARSLYERSLIIREQLLGWNHPDTVTTLNNLARLLTSMGEYTKARSLYERALTIQQQN